MTDGPDTMRGMPEEEILAAEYALGLLEGEARRAFEARLGSDPALARAVRDWEAHFARLAEHEVDEATPPPRVKAAVAAEIFGGSPASGAVRDRAGFWRALALGMTAVAAVSVFLAVRPPEPQPPASGIPPGTILMSHLVPVEGSGLGLAVTREPGGALRLRRVAGGPSAGRAQEVWLIPDPEAPPISIGLLSEDPLTTLEPPADVVAAFEAGATLAISEEPEGGSPTGAPTGPILAAGRLVPL